MQLFSFILFSRINISQLSMIQLKTLLKDLYKSDIVRSTSIKSTISSPCENVTSFSYIIRKSAFQIENQQPISEFFSKIDLQIMNLFDNLAALCTSYVIYVEKNTFLGQLEVGNRSILYGFHNHK